jgi:hypothetical protein
MLRLCIAALVVTALVAQVAEARGRRGYSRRGQSAPAAAAQTPQAPTAPVQAQRPEATRSYSYSPGTYVAPIGGDYGLEGYYNAPRESWGLRPASAKANSNY